MLPIRGITALLTTAIFLFPIFWWALTSIKPMNATINIEEIIFFDFEPTLKNYKYSLQKGTHAFYSSFIIAIGSSLMTVTIGLLTSFCLSRIIRLKNAFTISTIIACLMAPTIVLIMPVTVLMRDLHIHDTHLAVIFLHSFSNLPVATLILLIFMNKIPLTLDETASIDGASRFQFFIHILLPLMRLGSICVFTICFFLSYTEFLMSVFLTSSIKTIPVKITTFGSQTFGAMSAFGTSSLFSTICFVVIVWFLGRKNLS